MKDTKSLNKDLGVREWNNNFYRIEDRLMENR